MLRSRWANSPEGLLVILRVPVVHVATRAVAIATITGFGLVVRLEAAVSAAGIASARLAHITHDPLALAKGLPYLVVLILAVEHNSVVRLRGPEHEGHS